MAEGLCFAHGQGPALLDGFDLQLEPDAITVLLGPSGCGKSTLLRLLAGLWQPSRGRVQRRETVRCATVFQEPRLLPWRSVSGNLEFALEAAGVPVSARPARIREALAQVDLSGVARDLPHTLSGGMAQRAALARALCVRPDLLLLDEPFAALDAVLRAALGAHLRGLLRPGLGMVLVTHDVLEAAALADRVLVLAGPPLRVALDHSLAPAERDTPALAAALRAALRAAQRGPTAGSVVDAGMGLR